MTKNNQIENVILSFEQVDNEVMETKIGNKAINLIKLNKAGFPVPFGYCITNYAYEYYLKNDEILPGLIQDIIEIKKKLGSKIAIRSSANYEDCNNLSMAGIFDTCFVYDDDKIATAIKKIYMQSRSNEVTKYLNLYGININNLKLSLIVQELIDSDVSGVIYTGIEDDGLLIQYFDGYDENLLDGSAEGSIILLDKSGQISKSNGFDLRPLSSNAISLLNKYAHSIKEFYNGVNQDIEFSYKNGKVYILQSRPLTTDLGNVEIKQTPQECLKLVKQKLKMLVEKEKSELGTYTAIFSDSNYSELLPRPTEMDIGIYTYIFTGSDGVSGATQKARNEMGYLNGNESIGIISCIGGRTYFSISRNAALYHIGFPKNKKEYFTTLVNEYLKAIEKKTSKRIISPNGSLSSGSNH